METVTRKNLRKPLLLVAILVGAIELRCPITGVGSLVPMIRESLGLSNALAGMITSIPLIAFGICSILVSKALKKYRAGNVILMGICFIGMGIIIRSFGGTVGLFFGTVVIGIGISIGNVMTPAIIKAYFPDKVGLMTSTYTTLMAMFSTIASLVAVTLAKHLGWNMALFVWFVIPVMALLLWLPNRSVELADNPTIEPVGDQMNTKKKQKSSIMRDSMTWWVVLYMGVQTLFFYCFVSWFATILQSKGYSAEMAGYFNSAYMMMGIVGSFSLPILAARKKKQSGLGVVLGLIYVTGLVSILYAQIFPLLVLGTICCGYCQGACFSFVMVLFGLHTSHPVDTSALSGLAQSGGYLLASITPTAMGYIYDQFGTWNAPLKCLIFLAVLLTGLGYLVGREHVINVL